MESAMYVALSAQIALERRLDTIAQNVANTGTAGYRAAEVRFESVLDGTGSASRSFVSSGEEYVSRRAGELTQTDNPLDIAVQGAAWLAIQTPVGVAYTRDGRMQMLETGELVTLQNYPVLDVGRAPLVIDPDGGPPIITRDGMITQRGQQLGAVGLFRIDPSTALDRFENAAVLPRGPVTEVLDFNADGVAQGFVEGSNVRPMMEISNLIAVTRAFDAANSTIQQTESTSSDAIRTLGDTA
jgi:flagellar basal-body rod protein FlgF